MRDQLARSGTSIGANVEEADGSDTKGEKRLALRIARKETRETRYWLRIAAKKWPAVDADTLILECTEILYILSTIVRKLS